MPCAPVGFRQVGLARIKFKFLEKLRIVQRSKTIQDPSGRGGSASEIHVAGPRDRFAIREFRSTINDGATRNNEVKHDRNVRRSSAGRCAF
jgi:hypothetical protein